MIVFLDFEASSLGKNGSPIEVAWIFEDGREETHLIRPAPGWTDWDEDAEAIHGIAQAELALKGEPHDAVARRLLAELGDHDVFASAPSWDGKWLSLLLRSAGLPRHALRLKDTDEIQTETARSILRGAVEGDALGEEAEAAVRQAHERLRNEPVEHRALGDARRERRIWLEVRALAQERAGRADPAGGGA